VQTWFNIRRLAGERNWSLMRSLNSVVTTRNLLEACYKAKPCPGTSGSHLLPLQDVPSVSGERSSVPIPYI
jgi:hypothetical protein